MEIFSSAFSATETNIKKGFWKKEIRKERTKKKKTNSEFQFFLLFFSKLIVQLILKFLQLKKLSILEENKKEFVEVS